jgi:RNA polymerase sigma factor (sigma-70 family)
MFEENAFRALLARVQTGDQQAATELVRQYEPALRRVVRLSLRDRRLRRLFDSSDVCQGVLLHFFVYFKTAPHAFSAPDQVLKLLATMARNHLVNQALYQQALRRDHRRVLAECVEKCDVVARGSSPSQHVAAEEMLQKVRRMLAPEEWHLLELRRQGNDWAAIARAVGGSAEALRKQLARAVARVARVLDLKGTLDD